MSTLVYINIKSQNGIELSAVHVFILSFGMALSQQCVVRGYVKQGQGCSCLPLMMFPNALQPCR